MKNRDIKRILSIGIITVMCAAVTDCGQTAATGSTLETTVSESNVKENEDNGIENQNENGTSDEGADGQAPDGQGPEGQAPDGQAPNGLPDSVSGGVIDTLWSTNDRFLAVQLRLETDNYQLGLFDFESSDFVLLPEVYSAVNGCFFDKDDCEMNRLSAALLKLFCLATSRKQSKYSIFIF